MAEMKRVAVPSAVKGMAFSIKVPTDFQQLPLPPADEHDFSNPGVMMPLAIFMAGYGAILCSVAVRPMATGPDGKGIGEGSVYEWVSHLAMAQAGSQVKKLMPEQRWGTTTVGVEALQPSEAGEMIIQGTFFEDGGNLFNVSIMAPVAVWESVKGTLMGMAESFALADVQGPTRGISPGQAPPNKALFPLEAPQEKPVPVAPKIEETLPPGVPNLCQYALNDGEALDPEQAINVRFREAGAGLVPKVLATFNAQCCVLVGAGALQAMLPVPRGWHAIDDGRRALVFDGGNNVQVNFELMAIEDRSPADIFNSILEDLRTQSPSLEHREGEAEGMHIMQVRNLLIDGESLEQAYVLKRHPTDDKLALKVRTTATGDNLAHAMNMAGDLIGAIRFMA